MLYQLKDIITDVKENIIHHNVGLGTRNCFKKQLDICNSKLIVKLNAPKNKIFTYSNMKLENNDYLLKIGNKMINIKIILKEKLNVIDLTYTPDLNLEDEDIDYTSNCGEIVPNNKVTQHLIKALIYPKTGNNQRLKIAKALACLWD